MITIGIVSQDDPEKAESLAMLVEAAEKQKAKAVYFHPAEIDFLTPAKNEPYKKVDILYPRLYAETNFEQFLLSVSAVQQFINAKIPVINSLRGLIIGADKFRQYQVAANAGINIPKTSLIASIEMILPALENFNFPVVIKRQFGYGGTNVAIVESERSAKSIIGSFLADDHPVLIQEYLKIKDFTDFRVYVVGDKAIFGIIRTAPKGDFRANVTQGGKRKFFKPDQEISELALKVANVVGLEICAVDFLKYKNKYYMVELNRSMSVEPYSGKHKIVADEIIKYCIEKCKRK